MDTSLRIIDFPQFLSSYSKIKQESLFREYFSPCLSFCLVWYANSDLCTNLENVFNKVRYLKRENIVNVIYERSLSGPHKYVGDFLSFVFIFAAAPQRRYTGLFVLPRKEVKCGFWLENAQHIYYFNVILKIEYILGWNFRLS